MRIKRPDEKNALSLIDAAKKEIEFTLKMKVSEEAGSTIVRNIYEIFRMVGDAILISKGIKSEDHILPINELLKIKIKTNRPLYLIDNLRRFRHNINYYGYKPTLFEVHDVISIAKEFFSPLLKEALKIIKKV